MFLLLRLIIIELLLNELLNWFMHLMILVLDIFFFDFIDFIQIRIAIEIVDCYEFYILNMGDEWMVLVWANILSILFAITPLFGLLNIFDSSFIKEVIVFKFEFPILNTLIWILALHVISKYNSIRRKLRLITKFICLISVCIVFIFDFFKRSFLFVWRFDIYVVYLNVWRVICRRWWSFGLFSNRWPWIRR